MAFLAPLASSIFLGFRAAVEGFIRTARAPTIWAIYLRFAFWFGIIAVTSYCFVGATYAGLMCLSTLVMLGPIGGPLTLLFAFPTVVGISTMLWWFGLFPTSLFYAVSGGVLSPFIGVPSVAYFLSTLFVPMSVTQFFIAGADQIFDKHDAKAIAKKAIVNSCGFWRRFQITLFHFVFALALTYSTEMGMAFLPMMLSHKQAVRFGVAAFLTSSNLLTVWTVRIQNKSMLNHVVMVGQNVLLLISFGFPIQYLRGVAETSNNVLVWGVMLIIELGLASAMSAALVLVIIKNEKIKL